MAVIMQTGHSSVYCRAQSDKIFSQQSSLGKSHEELRSLRGQLERRAAQQEVIEAEISRQVEEYGRLRRQLVDQEELQVGSFVCWTGNMHGEVPEQSIRVFAAYNDTMTWVQIMLMCVCWLSMLPAGCCSYQDRSAGSCSRSLQ